MAYLSVRVTGELLTPEGVVGTLLVADAAGLAPKCRLACTAGLVQEVFCNSSEHLR